MSNESANKSENKSVGQSPSVEHKQSARAKGQVDCCMYIYINKTWLLSKSDGGGGGGEARRDSALRLWCGGCLPR